MDAFVSVTIHNLPAPEERLEEITSSFPRQCVSAGMNYCESGGPDSRQQAVNYCESGWPDSCQQAVNYCESGWPDSKRSQKEIRNFSFG